MFINLSNHPLATWGERQLEVAGSFGECIDMQFPNIAPTLSKSDVEAFATEFEEKILSLSAGKSCAVHIMGEMSFVYQLVSRLKKHDITCLASTTRRNVVTRDNGVKESIFEFVQFREY